MGRRPTESPTAALVVVAPALDLRLASSNCAGLLPRSALDIWQSCTERVASGVPSTFEMSRASFETPKATRNGPGGGASKVFVLPSSSSVLQLFSMSGRLLDTMCVNNGETYRWPPVKQPNIR